MNRRRQSGNWKKCSEHLLWIRELSLGKGAFEVKATGIHPLVLNEIDLLAQKYRVKKVILFGSRARGDYKRTSDIDLAVDGGDFEHFALDVEEETSTLLKFDIVDLQRNIQKELRKSIEREGIIIYEEV